VNCVRSAMEPFKLLFLVGLCTHLFGVKWASATIIYSHQLVIYECDSSDWIYRFQPPEESVNFTVTKGLSSWFGMHKIDSPTTQYQVSLNKASLNTSEFQFSISTSNFIINISGEVRQCEQVSSDRCTILVSIFASICLLLFAALAISLIVLKEKQLPCLAKFLLWFRKRSNGDQTSEQPSSNPDLDHLKRIYENGIKAEPDTDDSPPMIPPKHFPRKSSLKPPRTESFPELHVLGQSEVSVVPDPLRRKSIVTFNERTEIRA